MSRSKELAHLGANILPIYRVYAGYHTAERLKTDMQDPKNRTWGFAGRVALDAATDKLDGLLARYAGPTKIGGYLDQMADKAWFLLIARQVAANGEIPSIYVALPAIRDIGTTVLRPIATRYGLNSDAKAAGKAKMLAQINATIAACSPIAAENPEFIETMYGIAAGASVVAGVDMCLGYADEIANKDFQHPAAQFIAQSTLRIAEIA